MKKSALFAPALIAAMALSAAAQQGIQTNADRKETLKVTVSGGFDVDWVYRGKEIVAVLGALGSGSSGEDEGRIESNANVRFDIDLSNKVSVVLNLATVRLNGDYSNIGQLGADGQNVELWDLAIRMQEVLDPAVVMQVGTNNDFMFDIRGKGSPLFFAPGMSGAFGENSGGTLDYNQVAGAVVWYNRDAAHFALALLPAIIEGGPAGNDDAAYAVTFYYDLDSVGKGSRLGAILSFNSMLGATAGGSTSSVLTIGAGATLKGLGGMNNLEVFGEFYFQTGDVGTGDAGGTALNLGARLDLEGESLPWVELQITMLSGDDDPLDTDRDEFMSYENVNDFLIVESNMFGVNLGTNMFAIKIMGGISFTSGGGEKNNMSLTGGLGLFTASEDILTPSASVGNTDEIGTEFDVKLTYWYSRAVSMDVAVAFLFGSEVLEGFTAPDDEDSTMLFTFGVSGRF